MPITSSAKKAMRVAERRRVVNLRRTRTMRDNVKEVINLAKAGQGAEAGKLLPEAYKAIDKAAKRGVIKANTAARKKSRIAKLVGKASEKK